MTPRAKDQYLWARTGCTVRYTSPVSGRMHVGMIAYTRDDGRSLYVRFDPPIDGCVSPTKVPRSSCEPSTEKPK